MLKLRNKIKKLYNSDYPLKIEWIILALLAIFMFYIFIYIDLHSLTVWSTNLLDCISKGDIKNFFLYTSLNKNHIVHRYITGVSYYLIPWAIWNIPIWLVSKIPGISFARTPLLLTWSKFFLVVCLYLCVIYIKKIITLLRPNIKKSKLYWAAFLTFSSVFTLTGIFYAGQNDIMICLLILIAYYELMKKNNKTLFYIISSFAVSIKYFYLIPFVFITLLTEKKIWKIFIKIFVVCIPSLLYILVCHNWPMYSVPDVTFESQIMLKQVYFKSLSITPLGSVSIFLLLIIALAFIAYITKPKNNDERNELIIYYTFAGFTILSLFLTSEFYRYVLLVPFLYIIIAINSDKYRLNMICDVIISIAYVIAQGTIRNQYFYGSSSLINIDILTKNLGKNYYNRLCISDFFVKIFNNYYMVANTIATTVFIAGFLILLIINYPRLKKKFDESKFSERYLIWIRSFILIPVIIYLFL